MRERSERRAEGRSEGKERGEERKKAWREGAIARLGRERQRGPEERKE